MIHILSISCTFSFKSTELPADKNCFFDLTIKANSPLSIQSEGYPEYYSDFLDCTWVVRSSGSQGVRLNFLDIDFDTAGGDFLEVGNGETPGPSTLVERYTEKTEDHLDLETAVVWITFRTDGGVSGRGFFLLAEDLIGKCSTLTSTRLFFLDL